MDLVKRCEEFIVISFPFHPPRSPFSASNKAVELMLENDNAVEEGRKIVCIIERGVKSYG
jgi:hypothetical protein